MAPAFGARKTSSTCSPDASIKLAEVANTPRAVPYWRGPTEVKAMMMNRQEKTSANAEVGERNGMLPKAELIGSLDLSDYWKNGTSLYRKSQDRFLQTYGPELTGDVKELGAERKYNHQRFFPNAASYSLTNIARDHDEYQDLTALSYPDNSIDGYVC